ncbi:mevalonate kinase family protein [Apilactobacillus ozensis]|uniref:mevalonate kinase family protein n=1 Tax=Apilactobacillus ozensis TaxID=866801 RepID=UPI0020922091|nr:hypothetical protein [Apilactobacillus ozensis]
MGEHSVVYNKPAIALPVTSVALRVEIEPNIENSILIDSDYYRGKLNNVPVNMLGVKKLIHQTLKKIDKENEHFKMFVKSDIPSERGMGSSAATAIGIIKAICNYFNQPINREELLKLSDVEEKK